MPEQRQQLSYTEENDTLQDDTLKTPVVRPPSSVSNRDDDESDEMDIQATTKMPAIKNPLSSASKIKDPLLSERSVDTIPMAHTSGPTQNEQAALISLIAEVLSATVKYAQAELVTTLARQAHYALTQQAQGSTLPSASPPLTPSLQQEKRENNTTDTIETSETNETFASSHTSAMHEIAVAVQEPLVRIMDTPRPQEEVLIPATPITPRPSVAPIFPQTAGRPRTRSSVVHRPKRLSLWRRILAALFSVLLIASFVLLWRDLSASHLLLATLNPANGTFTSQQDIASYQDHPALATAAYGSSSIVASLHNDTATDGTHRVFVFHNNNGQWNAQAQFSAPLAHDVLQLAPDGQILINTPQTIQARSADGHLLWTALSDQPLQGAHRFQAVSNNQTLYTIKSLPQSQIVAYDLHSGQTNWVQTLDDSLNYTPPFLLSASMLYIASDHNIYALNNSDGTLLWQQPYPSRTLLLTQQGQTTLLLAAGTHGLLALDPATGQPVWTFKAQASDALTAPELYQATAATTTAPFIYTTGITWRIPQIQEQVWLYAVDARSGTQVWAKQVGNSFISADAGRLFSPQLDTTHHLVLLQQQTSTDSQNIAAFDATDGTLRWTTTLKHSTPATTTLLETSAGTPLVLRTLTNSSDLLWIFSPFRLLLLTAFLGSIIMLCLLLLFPLYTLLTHFIAPSLSSTISSEQTKYQHVYASKKRVRTELIALVLLVCISAGILGTLRLTQTQETITQLSTRTGSIVWQHAISQPAYPLLTNAHGSVVAVNDNSDNGNNGALTQLQSLNTAGAVNWQTFSSEGTFATPTDTLDTSSTDTLLVTLSGHGLRPYQFAPDDSAYQHAINTVLVVYLFDQASGNILWQHVTIGPTEQQQGVVLGVDAHDLYIASTPIVNTSASLVASQKLSQPSTGQTSQLIAINRHSGIVDWRIFGPSADASVQDTGTLLLQHGLAIWQVRGSIYAIDTAMGQIAWRHPLQSDAAAVLVQEEQQELATPDTLLINRLDGVHALSLASGNELWHLSGPDSAALPAKAGFVVAGHSLLVYNDGQLRAYDLQSRQTLWSQTQPSSIHYLRVSHDGTLLYLLLLNTVQGNTLAPSVVALDTQTGVTRWTFTLLSQTPLSTGNPDSFFYSNGTLFVISCTNTETRVCSNQYLYALNGVTGKIAWKFTDTSISHIHVSQDGSSLILHTTSSGWANLLSHLQG